MRVYVYMFICVSSVVYRVMCYIVLCYSGYKILI